MITVAGVSLQESAGDAELSVLPIGAMPMIPPNKETIIPLKYTDNFGMNWTTLQYFKGSTGLGVIRSFITTRIIWPIIHPTWKPFLGYTRVEFGAEIVGNPNGWIASVNPTTIPQSTDGTKADLSLKVYVNDLNAANTVTVRISATRFLKDNSEYGISYFDIPVRSEKLNYIDIKPDIGTKEVRPDSMTTFQIDITNLGYFIDNFAAKVSSDKTVKGVLSEQSFVLQPGETRRVTLQILTADNIFDPGTTHTITINAYSLKNPEKQFTGQVQVITKGFYFSALTISAIGVTLCIILIFFLIIYYFIIRKYIHIGKPDKPWNIPEERAYLEELKKTDKAEYERVLKMMDEEYQSAMLWYEDYCQAMKQEQKSKPTEKGKRVFPRLFKKSTIREPEEVLQQQKPVEQSVEQPKETRKPLETTNEIPEMIPVEEKPVDQQPLVEADENKLKALLKIKRDQEKQRKRLLKK